MKHIRGGKPRIWTDDQPQPTTTSAMHRSAGQETAKVPGSPGRPDGSFERMRHVFHELRAAGRPRANAIVCL